MTRAGLFLYPWCFAEEGCDELVAYVRGLGVRRMYVASSYHAGFFLQPHSPQQKVRLLEDGVVYFHPDEAIWHSSRIQPAVSSLCEPNNLLGEISAAAAEAGMELSAWTVCLHNTLLGLRHPECTIHNVYGDSYPHALTPGHPDARAYVARLVDDLTQNYSLHSVLLEAPNYRNRAHGGTWVSGHHHERNGVHLRELEEALLSVSFNPADTEAATAAGVDVVRLRGAVRDHLDRYFAAAPEIPKGLPQTLDEFRQQNQSLADYETHFRNTEETLLAELRQIAEPKGVKLVGSASPSNDIVQLGAYGESAEWVAESTRTAREKLAAHQELEVALRMGFSSPGMGTAIRSCAQMQEFVQAARRNGADSVAFYNYAEAPRRSVEWIREAIDQ